MKVETLHNWQVNVAQALDIQRRLAGQISRNNQVATLRFVAGVDISVNKARGMATAAAVVLNYPELRVVETKLAQGKLDFPYVPGLLSFRESPLILAACQRLKITPDLIMVDGQGIAHPRRMGLASHLGLFLDMPAIGCAKSLLCGSYEVPGEKPGSYTEIVDGGETIGAALRTKPGTKPVFVSIGHKIALQSAIHWVLGCCQGYRLPEPSRLAHLAAGGTLRQETETTASEVGYQMKFLD